MIDLIQERFIHRSDTYARQWYNEAKGVGYVKATVGTCTESCPKNQCPHVTDEPITDDVLAKHLNGEHTIGIYQLSEDNTVKWACIDVDIKKGATGDDLRERAQNQTVDIGIFLRKIIDRRFLVEDSGSRGYHVWIFFDEPVLARDALALLNFVALNVAKQENITLELFPKRTAMKSYGNMVKLPLGIHLKTNNPCLFVSGLFQPYPDQEEILRQVLPLTNPQLKWLIKEYGMEVDPSIRVAPAGNGGKAGGTGLPCQTRMMEEGFKEGCRDDGMFAVACFLKDRGIPLDIAYPAMVQLNSKNQPPMHDETINEKLQSAYSKDFTPFPCGKNSLDQYCSSRCQFFDRKVSERWRAFGRKDSPIGKISRD